MNGERRQSHGCNALEDGPLRHDSSVVLNGRYPSCNDLAACQYTALATKLYTLGIRCFLRKLLHLTNDTRSPPCCCHVFVFLLLCVDLCRRLEVVLGVEDLLVAHIRLVAFVGDIASQVQPRDTICALDKIWVGDWSKGLADIRGVGDIAMGREHDGANASCVGCIAEGGISGILCSVVHQHVL